MMGALPLAWRWATVGEVAEVTGGLTKNAGKRDASKVRVPLVSVAAVHLRRIDADAVGEVGLLDSDGDRATLKRGDLLIVEGNGSLEHIGRVALWNDEVPGARHQNHIIRIRPRDLSSRFVLEWLASPAGRVAIVNEATSAAGLYTLSLSKVERLPIPVPPPSEQRRIVAKLDALQARSRRARAALDAVPPLLAKLRQSILAAAFRGDLTKDWRAKHKDVEPASELLTRIRAERRRTWEEAELAKMKAKGKAPTDDRWKAKYKEPEPVDTTGLPELPEGWCWSTFDTVAEVELGRQRAPQYQTGRFSRPYLRVANVKDDRIDLSDVLEMDFDEEDFAHYQLRTGDILLSEGQSPELVGQSAIYEGGIDGLCFQKTLHRFRAYPSGPSPQYAQLVFRHYVRAGTFRSVASLTVNIAHLTLVRLKPLHFPVPPKPEEEELVRRAQGALDRVKQFEASLSLMRSRHRDLERSLLAKAFRGELVPQLPDDEPTKVTHAVQSQPRARSSSERERSTASRPGTSMT